MADNTELDLGSGGDIISTDDLGTIKVQRVKIQTGTDGNATDVSTANPVPVSDAGGSLTVDNAVISVVGGGTEATAQRVTLASDSTGVLSVDDNGSTLSVDDGGASLTVDVGTALPAGTNNIGDVDIASIAAGDNNIGNVDIVSLPALVAGTANIGDVDVLSVIPGTGATALGKAEDAVAASGDTGVAVLGVRRDAASVGGAADGDYANLSVDSVGSLRVHIESGSTAGGMVDDAAFTPGNTSIMPAGGTYRTTRDDLDDNDGGAIALTQKRAVYTTIETTSGDSCVDDTNDAVRVNVVAGGGLVGGETLTDGITAADDAATITNGEQYGSVAIDISGTFVATLQFEATIDLSNWFSLKVTPVGSVTPVTSTTAGGRWQAQLGGFNRVRVRASAYTSGTAVVKLSETQAGWNPPGLMGATGNMASVIVAGSSNALSVVLDGSLSNVTVDVASVIAGTTSTALGKAEDAAAGNGYTGVAMLAVRRDAATSGAGTDGDFASPAVDANGLLWTNVGAALPAGTNNIGDVDVLTLPGVAGTAAHDAAVSGNPLLAGGYASAAAPSDVNADGDAVRAWHLRNGAQATVLTAAGSLVGGDATNGLDVDVTRVSGTVTVGGTAAHDAAVSGSPVLVGLEARTSDGTAVSNGDAVRAMASTLGKIVVLPGSILANQVQGNLNETNDTASDVIAAAGAGVKIAVMSITVTNKHATVSSTVTIRDGTTAKFGPQYALAAGGGFHATGGGYPLFVGTANTAVTALAGTNGSDLLITVTGYLTTE